MEQIAHIASLQAIQNHEGADTPNHCAAMQRDLDRA